MCRQILEKSHFQITLPDPLPRNNRTLMKPRLPRKITASARINLNRFWNELEEFYNRYDERSKPVLLPEYTTDTFDHERESAENKLNEEIEQNENIPVDSDSDFEDDIFIWNVHEKSTTPPKTLMDLVHKLCM